jgi:DNA-directed RNA polymerase specialized sigma54-like protein
MNESEYESIISHITRQLNEAKTTARDEFAKAALIGLLSKHGYASAPSEIAEECYDMAEAMMKEREKYVSKP